jgi:biopolymer transport protein ExbD
MPSSLPDDDGTGHDMTPMIDVVFLMIVFFACIDFRSLEAKLPAFLPKDRGSSLVSVEPIEQLLVQVHVDADGEVVHPRGVAAGDIDPATGRPHRFALVRHRVRWDVGPRPVATLDDLAAELRRVARSPGSQVPDPATGGRKLIAAVIEPRPGVRYDDVARTADALREAGFADIHFGAGLGPR